MSQVGDAFGVAGGVKYGYQASRAIRGLGTTTFATAGLDLASGSFGTTAAADAAETAKSLATTSKGTAGAAKISRFARIAKVAGRAAPVLAKGSAVLGVGLGGYKVGQGVHKLTDNRTDNDAAGRDKVISGTADVITSGALGVAAVSSGTVVGLPVAGVALGVAGVSQGAKYAWKYRDKLGDAAQWTGNKISQGAGWAADQAGDIAGDISSTVSSGYNSLKNALF